MKPIIGINLDIQDGMSGSLPTQAKILANYYESIEYSGGIAVLIPPMYQQNLVELVERLNGFMFIGGNDYSPKIYGEKTSDKVQLISATREEFDLRLVKYVLTQTKLPILGICGGLQLLNVSLGGSLIQDIPTHMPESKIKHSKPNAWQNGFPKHYVSIEHDSMLRKIYNCDSLEVNSFHHQAINKLAPGLEASAYAEDGIIEAIELPNRAFTLAVQWHPERDFENNKSLFEQFVQACKQIKAKVVT